MASKKVTIGPKPQERIADDWVNGVTPNTVSTPQEEAPQGAAESVQVAEPASTDTSKSVPLKRLTIDIPETLHTRIKMQCAQRRTKMVDEIRSLLETHFPE